MKYLRSFNESLDVNPPENEISEICRKYGIENWTLNGEGLVDVDGTVNLGFCQLTRIPLKFGNVGRDFWCGSNDLINLEGCPKNVGGDFYCSYNHLLTSLEGGPQSVGGDFKCSNNVLLTSFEGAPKIIGGIFWCFNNPNLWSFEGSPESVDYFECDNSPLEEIWNLFEDFDQVELLNDFDPIRMIGKSPWSLGTPTVILDRLNSFLEMIGKPKVTTLKNYKVI